MDIIEIAPGVDVEVGQYVVRAFETRHRIRSQGYAVFSKHREVRTRCLAVILHHFTHRVMSFCQSLPERYRGLPSADIQSRIATGVSMLCIFLDG